MVVSLDQTQQERVYKYYYNHFYPVWNGKKQLQMDETTRRQEINKSLGNLQQYLNQKDLRGLHLQDAMIDYLVIREHEEALHLSPICVPDILRPHFQNISHQDFQKVVKRLVIFCSPAVPVNLPQHTSVVPVNLPQPTPTTALETPPVAVSQEALFEVLIESYNSVRAGRIKSPETIREIARRFSEIENDPEDNKDFPYDAGEAARILIQRAKLYEDHGIPGDTHKI
jgi:hypothetical protein